jgi:hypothetical protein
MREMSFFQLIPSLGRRVVHFKGDHGGKAIQPKLPIEVHLIGRVNITSIRHQSKLRNEI